MRVAAVFAANADNGNFGQNSNRLFARPEAAKFRLVLSIFVASITFGQVPLTTAQIAKKVSPSVVVIKGKSYSGDVLGSGFVISKDGKIVTNFHVIRNMRSASVEMADGKSFNSVSVLATDERRDLAIVQIAGSNLPVLELGNSDALTTGEPVVAVGSPRGLEGTVTAGILSSVRDTGDGFKVLQTDAAVNPGNSGGPLVNGNGQAIGVVSFKLLSSEGLNFAIPISYVRGLLNNIHEPIPLERMPEGSPKATAPPPTTPGQPDTGASLNETLGWLAEKLPSATVNYVESIDGKGVLKGKRIISAVSVQATVTSLDGCTAVFGSVQRSVATNLPEVGNSTITLQYTVQLGALTEWSVQKRDNELFGKTDDNITFIGGDMSGYVVLLRSTSNEISLSLSSEIRRLTSRRTNTASVTFNDASLARRVAAAFHHASDLCRVKEPF
jgi:S1-C subfamily serine protease